MTKIVLEDTNSGYNLSQINDNFAAVEDFINNKVLSRDNPSGDPNQMVQTLDMNGQRIINLPEPVALNEAARLQDIVNATIGIIPFLPAAAITFVPGHGVTATDVQHAIEQLGDASSGFAALVTAEASTRASADTNEATARASADTALQTQINTNSTAISVLVNGVASAAHVCLNIAALRALDHTKFGAALTLGYFNLSDGGNGLYYWAPFDTTSADNGGNIIVASDGARWYLSQNGPMNLFQWGCKGDGVTDDWGRIQTALTTTPTNTSILVPKASFRCSNTLTLYGGRSFIGQEHASDVTQGYSQFIFDLGVEVCLATDAITSTAGPMIKNITINRAAGSFSGTCIGLLVNGPDMQVIQDVTILRHAIGIKVQNCLSAFMQRVNTYYCTWAHVQLSGCVEPRFDQCRFGRNGAADFPCVQYIAILNGVDTVRFDTCQMNQSGNTVTQCVKWYGYNNANGIFHFNNCHMEAWTTAVFVADASTVAIQRLKVTNSSITINGSGAQFYIGAAGILQDSSFVNNNFDVTISMDSHTGMVFSGNNISGQTSFNSGRYSVSGNCFGSNVTLTGVANHSVLGINSILGTLTNSATGVVVTGNN